MASSIDRIKLISRKRVIVESSNLEYQYLPDKEQTQFYEDFINSVELEFGKCSNKFWVFGRLYQDCKEQRITAQEIDLRVDELFKDHPKLLIKFCNTVLPYLYPLGTRDEVDRANQFIHIVESAFPNNQKRSDSVVRLVINFRDGRLTLKEMTVKMLKLLENRDELIKAFIKFVPQSENVIASIISIRSFFSYLTIIAITLAFGIGLYATKN